MCPPPSLLSGTRGQIRRYPYANSPPSTLPPQTHSVRQHGHQPHESLQPTPVQCQSSTKAPALHHRNINPAPESVSRRLALARKSSTRPAQAQHTAPADTQCSPARQQRHDRKRHSNQPPPSVNPPLEHQRSITPRPAPARHAQHLNQACPAPPPPVRPCTAHQASPPSSHAQ
jgi:hypothetical protein